MNNFISRKIECCQVKKELQLPVIVKIKEFLKENLGFDSNSI